MVLVRGQIRLAHVQKEQWCLRSKKKRQGVPTHERETLARHLLDILSRTAHEKEGEPAGSRERGATYLWPIPIASTPHQSTP